MGTLTEQMQALIDYSNETTGESDTTLSGAIDTLVAGYGGGSSDTLYLYPYNNSTIPEFTYTNVGSVNKVIIECNNITITGKSFSSGLQNTSGTLEVVYQNASNVIMGTSSFDYCNCNLVVDCGGAKIPAGNTGGAYIARHRSTGYTLIIKNIDVSLCKVIGAYSGDPRSIDFYPIGTTTSDITEITCCTSTIATLDSFARFFECLYDFSGTGTTANIAIGTENYNALSADVIAIATNKGWTIND